MLPPLFFPQKFAFKGTKVEVLVAFFVVAEFWQKKIRNDTKAFLGKEIPIVKKYNKTTEPKGIKIKEKFTDKIKLYQPR